MSKKPKYMVMAIGMLAIVYYLVRLTASYVLENYTEGPHVFFAQTLFAPDDLFSPVVSVNFKSINKLAASGYGFDFSPKYLGPYRVGIAGVHNDDWYIPNSIKANLECNIGGESRSYMVDEVAMYSGTSLSGKGTVLGILHVEEHSKIMCLVRLDNIEFDDVDRVSSYQIVVARMFVK